MMHMIIDDNFSIIVPAVKESRTIFRNLEKTIKTNLSSNIAELTCVLAGLLVHLWVSQHQYLRCGFCSPI